MKSKNIAKLALVVFILFVFFCSLETTKVSKSFLNTLEFDGKRYVEHITSDVEVVSKAEKLVSSTGIGISKKHRYKVVTVYCFELNENVEVVDVPDWNSYEVGEKVVLHRDVFYSKSGIRLYYKDSLSHE